MAVDCTAQQREREGVEREKKERAPMEECETGKRKRKGKKGRERRHWEGEERETERERARIECADPKLSSRYGCYGRKCGETEPNLHSWLRMGLIRFPGDAESE